ncbi:SDR family oxidoreductase [Microbacterium sp. 18062]|uniref:SDR family NAD(P)-dependent oxidoreductase n=1 Tax=Microbacterium sp. 18062 TaxID=2681410 RepID=UPI001358D872|nr:SDR family oxidoreductase [Microbacterium sp. 18062]
MRTLIPGTTALVTGASSGLGVEFATRLARRKIDLVLVARREDRLQELAGRLRADTGVDVTVLPRDLSDPGAGAALHAEVAERGLTIGTLVNNAGFGLRGDVIDSDPDRLDEMVRLNVGALTALVRAFVPDMVRRRSGAIVNLASMAALAPIPHMAVYSATKAYVLHLTEALANELRGTGVTALAVSPGPTRTEFFDVAGGSIGSDGVYLTAEQVVDATLRALDRRRPPAQVVPGRGHAAVAALTRLLPRRALVAASGRLMR